MIFSSLRYDSGPAASTAIHKLISSEQSGYLGGQKPESYGTSGALNFLMPFVESYSGESFKRFSYCKLMTKIIQISHFRMQRTNHDHHNNPLKLL